MNNACDCTKEEIITALTSGEAVESGYGVDYTFKDIIEECRDMEDVLNELLTSTNIMVEVHGHEIKNELMQAANRVATEIVESYK